MWRRKLITALAACALSVAALAQATRPAPAPADADIAPAPRADRQEIRAHLVPVRYTTLASEIGARVRKIPFAEAQAFSREARLFNQGGCWPALTQSYAL